MRRRRPGLPGRAVQSIRRRSARSSGTGHLAGTATRNHDGAGPNPAPYSNQPPLLTPPIVPLHAARLLPRIVHNVPVIVCVDDGGSLPIARAPPALSSGSATRMAAGPLAIRASCRRPTMCGGVTTCRGFRHSGVRTQTCAPARHPSDQRGRWIVPPLTRRQPARPHQARERRPAHRRPEGPPIAPRSSESVPGPCSIRSSWPRSGRRLLAPTSPIAY